MHKRLSILLRVLVIALAVSGSVVHALSLRGFLEGYVGSSGGGQVQDASPEDIQTSVTTNEISSIDPKNAQVLYTTPGLAGSYKATLTIDIVCEMEQFKMLCGMMGLRRSFGDVRQHVYIDFEEDKRELYIKADGHKPLFRFDWCGPVGYTINEENLRSRNKEEIYLSKDEPPCMKELRKILKNDRYYYNKQKNDISVKAKIRPHSIVGWVNGALDFNSCTDPNCSYQ